MLMTYAHPWYSAQHKLASTTNSESQSTPKPSTVSRGPVHTKCDSRKGDFYEALVELEAWKRGAEVFPNKGCTGKTDMVLEINGQFVPVDVKSMRWNKRLKKYTSAKPPQKRDVYQVCVNPETQEIRWAYRNGGSRKFNCPAGLEDFWS